jgi:pimeloyl-ACP methyl ester carboxylesterase
LACACETACILLTTYIVFGIVLIVAVAALGDLITFANVPASACQAMPCTSASPAACCSYNVSSSRFEGEAFPRNFTYTTTDGSMHAWLMTNSSGPPSLPWLNILYSHGSGANVAVNYRLARYQWLLQRGRVRLFVYDYPGYGLSEGAPSPDGTDRAAAGAITTFKSYLNVTDDSSVTYLGRSMGGAVAVRAIAASDAGSVATRLILQSTFLSWGGTLAGLFPTFGWAMRAGFGDQFDSSAFANNFKTRADACAYQSHSTADEWVVFSEATALRDAVQPTGTTASGCKSAFYEYTTALHDDPLTPGEKTALSTWVASARA